MLAKNEWLQARKVGLGGSDIGAILGLSSFRTPLDVYLDKTGAAPDQEESLQMRFGTFAETFVAGEYSRITGNSVERFTKMMHHKTAPILGNVDRLVIPAHRKRASHAGEIRTDRLLECKTASAFAAYREEEWGEEGTDKVPMAYLVQCATYRILTGCRFSDLAVLFGNQEIRIYHLERDFELEDMIVAKASEWWAKHVLGGVHPDPISDADIKKLYPVSTPAKVVTADDMLLAELNRYRKAKQEIEVQKQIADEAKIQIQASIGDAEEIADQSGVTLATWKSSRPSKKTDWKAIATNTGYSNELYINNTTETAGSRRFLLKDEK